MKRSLLTNKFLLGFQKVVIKSLAALKSLPILILEKLKNLAATLGNGSIRVNDFQATKL